MRASFNFQGHRVNSKLTVEACICFAPASSNNINKVQTSIVGAQDHGGLIWSHTGQETNQIWDNQRVTRWKIPQKGSKPRAAEQSYINAGDQDAATHEIVEPACVSYVQSTKSHPQCSRSHLILLSDCHSLLHDVPDLDILSLNKADTAIGLAHGFVDYLASPHLIQESSDGNPLPQTGWCAGSWPAGVKDCAKGMVEKPDLAPATRGVGRRKQGRRRCSAQPRGEGQAFFRAL